MIVTVRFYGLIAELVQKSEEKVNLSDPISIEGLVDQHYRSQFKESNPVHTVAINNNIVRNDSMIENGDVIDLMPAFAGG